MNDARIDRIYKLVRDVPDFPKPGILFRDITPVLAEHGAFHEAIEILAESFRALKVDAVLGIESRGFMFGAPLALRLEAAFVPVRKPGKLPRATDRVSYALEYGEDALEMHRDALVEGARVLVIDDVIATGGTARAAIDLARNAGAEVVGVGFLIELLFLKGRDKLGNVNVVSLLTY
jgi:adenine phosphoribosyltransferase